jgi:hypothetical protein
MIATRIWLLAILLNTVFFTIVLAMKYTYMHAGFELAFLILLFGTFISLPGYLLLLLFNFLLRRYSFSKAQIFIIQMALSLLCTWFCVRQYFYTQEKEFALCPLISTVLSVLLQYRLVTTYGRALPEKSNFNKTENNYYEEGID